MDFPKFEVEQTLDIGDEVPALVEDEAGRVGAQLGEEVPDGEAQAPDTQPQLSHSSSGTLALECGIFHICFFLIFHISIVTFIFLASKWSETCKYATRFRSFGS